MRLKEKKLLQKFAATLKKLSAQGAKKVKYGIYTVQINTEIFQCSWRDKIFGGDGGEGKGGHL